jgi:ABC-type phosphate transport system substrate-binding protein
MRQVRRVYDAVFDGPTVTWKNLPGEMPVSSFLVVIRCDGEGLRGFPLFS